MALSVTQLRTPVPVDEVMADIIALLQRAGFNATSWGAGSLQYKFLNHIAAVYSDLTYSVKAIVDFGFNETAYGDGLVAFSKSHYDNAPEPALKTIGTFRLTNHGAQQYTINVGQLVVAYTEADGTQRTYRNTTGGTLNANPHNVSLTFEAETAGSSWNLATDLSPNSLILQTPLAGVTVSNPPLAGTNTWITTMGADQESEERLKRRNSLKWSSLSLEVTLDGVEYIALKACRNVTRVGVDDSNPRGPFTVDVYLAGESGGIGSSDIADVQTAMNRRFLGDPNTARCISAPTNTLSVGGTIFFDPSFSVAAVQTAVGKALRDYLATVPLGGFTLDSGNANIIPKNELERIIRDLEINGMRPVKGVILTTPVGDEPMEAFGVRILSETNLNYVPVAQSFP